MPELAKYRMSSPSVFDENVVKLNKSSVYCSLPYLIPIEAKVQRVLPRPSNMDCRREQVNGGRHLHLVERPLWTGG